MFISTQLTMESETVDQELRRTFKRYGFPGGSEVKASAPNAGGLGSIPGSRRSPGEGNGIPLSSILAWKIPWTEESGGL